MSVSSATAGATQNVSLPERARLAVVWTTGLNLFRDIVQFGVMLVMVRRLPHEAYGQFGLVNTILGFMMVFSSREFIAHTLLIRDDADLNYGEQFLAGCVVQTALCLGCNAVALALWRSPAYAPVAPLLHAMSPIFLLDLPSELRVRMLERALEWRRLRTIEAAGVVGAAALTLGLGLAGAGVYALLIPSFVVPTAFAIDLFLVAGWRPTWRWRPERYRASRRFGTHRVLSVSFVSASNLVESTILARAVGYAVLGVFGRAVGMATLLCGRASSLLMASLYPVLARIPPRSESYQRVSGLVLRVVAWLVVPAAALGSLLGSDLVRTLYGSRWLSVIPLVPWAMLVGAVMAAVQAAYSLLLAQGDADRCRNADLWRLVGTTLALLATIRFGLVAYFAALAVVHGVALALLLGWLITGNGLRLAGVRRAIVPAAGATVLAALVAETVGRWSLHRAPGVVRLGGYSCLFGAVYLFALRVCFPSLLRELLAYLPVPAPVERLFGFAKAA